MAVGVFDSGLGGLTVLDAVSRRLPEVPFVYFADSAHAPYGVRDADDIYDLTTAAVERLWEAGCDLVHHRAGWGGRVPSGRHAGAAPRDADDRWHAQGIRPESTAVRLAGSDADL